MFSIQFLVLCSANNPGTSGSCWFIQELGSCSLYPPRGLTQGQSIMCQYLWCTGSKTNTDTKNALGFYCCMKVRRGGYYSTGVEYTVYNLRVGRTIAKHFNIFFCLPLTPLLWALSRCQGPATPFARQCQLKGEFLEHTSSYCWKSVSYMWILNAGLLNSFALRVFSGYAFCICKSGQWDVRGTEAFLWFLLL